MGFLDFGVVVMAAIVGGCTGSCGAVRDMHAGRLDDGPTGAREATTDNAAIRHGTSHRARILVRLVFRCQNL